MSSRIALHPLLVGLLVCLLAGGSLAGSVAAQQPPPELVIEQHGSGVALEDESTTYLWQYSTYSVTVTFTVDSDQPQTVCLSQYEEATVEQPLTCQVTAVEPGEPTSVTLSQSEWPQEITGEETLAVERYTGQDTNGEPAEQVLLSVHIIEKGGDLAGNGLSNEREIQLGTHPARADTDGDGVTDGIEVMLGTGPRDPATPYRVAVVSVGSLSAGAFGFLLVAGRFVSVLQALGIRADHESIEEAAADTDDTKSFEPPIRDEERVRRLLSDHDGRLKQSQIVDATEWSKSKVSRLLSSMEDDEEITRVRLGRENLVCLRGHEPSDVTPSWKDRDGASP